MESRPLGGIPPVATLTAGASQWGSRVTLVCIPAVLDWTELKKVRAAIAEGTFEDGRCTAGRRAKRVKNNLQLKKGDDRADEIKDIVPPPP